MLKNLQKNVLVVQTPKIGNLENYFYCVNVRTFIQNLKYVYFKICDFNTVFSASYHKNAQH